MTGSETSLTGMWRPKRPKKTDLIVGEHPGDENNANQHEPEVEVVV